MRLHSLLARPELNGLVGTVVSALDVSKGRVGVRVGEERPLALPFEPEALEAERR